MENDTEKHTRLYRSRFLMLFLFIAYSMSNAFQWIEYSIISNIISYYYQVPNYAVSWTSIIYSVLYLILIVPSNWILEKKGLRFIVLLGSFFTCLGSWIKCCSLIPSRLGFAITMVGQSIVAANDVFILGIPSHLAGVWFGADEQCRACAVGVFGNQLGIALGFLLPPLIVPNSSNNDDIERGLTILYYSLAVINSVIFIFIVFFFKKKPPHPPSIAQAAVLSGDSRSSYWASMGKLCKNFNFMLLLVTYGIVVGVFYAISTFLNEIILFYNKGEEESVGLMGLIIVVAGMIGSVVCGVILDKTHRYKQVTLSVYVLSVLAMVAFTLVLPFGLLPMFFVSSLLGFFMIGYLPIGFEFAAELTYPEAEANSAGLLNVSANIFGIVLMAGGGALLEHYGDKIFNICLIVTLVVGSIATVLIKSDLRRYKVSQKGGDI
ncbi:feline leukemia virus subgroup C receptor-related protein 1 [Caerostris darwini]|uniref:Choline/ethanolamine transporter FLVCR1 n=1 Tax=Caerostris darwini TaxID=1538125 RepID=A0AAV4RGW4_9ARAC|nr:feline leukemia virus subgroup C receptor-related protein 1 [Caerostris darwini]